MLVKENNKMKKLISLLLILTVVLGLAACGTANTDETTAGTTAAVTTAPVDTTGAASDVTVLGEGAVVFTVVTTDLDGKETTFEVHTDAATVGEALVAVGLVEGHDTEYGLYVDAVNGIALDWEKDGKYWAFYINGEYAMTGVDATEIAAGSTYTFKAE